MVCFCCKKELDPVDSQKGTGVGRCPNPTCPRTLELKKEGAMRPYLRCLGCGNHNFVAGKGGLGGRELACDHCGKDIKLPAPPPNPLAQHLMVHRSLV